MTTKYHGPLPQVVPPTGGSNFKLFVRGLSFYEPDGNPRSGVEFELSGEDCEPGPGGSDPYRYFLRGAAHLADRGDGSKEYRSEMLKYDVICTGEVEVTITKIKERGDDNTCWVEGVWKEGDQSYKFSGRLHDVHERKMEDPYIEVISRR